jgi:Ca-activated chloride channel homolog
MFKILESWQEACYGARTMTRRQLITAGLGLTVVASVAWSAAAQDSVATFKSSIELVRVSAVVRDKNGRFVQNLTAGDFEVIDHGEKRAIVDFRPDASGVSIALLFDVSGSMKHNLDDAREAATHVLSWLEPDDEAAIYTFDTKLEEVAPFTVGLRTLPRAMSSVSPFGATSLHDAIAKTARQVGTREGRRRAIVVFTDGRDNASQLSAGDVSGIASSIDVPVYLFATVPSIDNPTTEFSTVTSSALSGSLSDLATWTGGHVFVASTPAARSMAARQIVDELRHQYLIVFEPSGNPGWHPLEVRVRKKDLTVRARSGYIAGQSRPIAN